jgi:hypothetical protein
MGWKATATVQDVSDNESPPVDILLVANGEEVTFDGDDQVTSVEIKVVSPVATHLVVGSQVQITADC